MNHTPLSDYILVLLQYGSVSKAAEKLGISQPALSVHIKKIESQLGIQIFDRSQKPLKLTESGRIYVAYLKRSLELEKEFRQRLSDLSELKTGNLAIGGPSFFNISYLPETIAAYTKRFPGVHLEVVDGKMPEIIEKALKDEIDLFLSPSWQQDDRFHYERILSERIFVCVPASWPINERLKEHRVPASLILSKNNEKISSWERQHCIDFQLLREEPFVLLKEDQHIGNIMGCLFERYDFQPERFILAEQTITSYALTMAGAGISLITESVIQRGHVKEYPAFYITEPDLCRREMYVAYPKQRYLSQASKAFIALLKSKL